MKRILPVLLCALIAGANATADQAARLVVVTHPMNPINTLTKPQVIDMFMGKYVAFPDGRKAQPLDCIAEECLKEEFYKHLVGMSLARVNSYWSRIRFTGRARPPVETDSIEAAISYIESNRHAVAYIPSNALNDKLKVVFDFNE